MKNMFSFGIGSLISLLLFLALIILFVLDDVCSDFVEPFCGEKALTAPQ